MKTFLLLYLGIGDGAMVPAATMKIHRQIVHHALGRQRTHRQWSGWQRCQRAFYKLEELQPFRLDETGPVDAIGRRRYKAEFRIVIHFAGYKDQPPGAGGRPPQRVFDQLPAISLAPQAGAYGQRPQQKDCLVAKPHFPIAQ